MKSVPTPGCVLWAIVSNVVSQPHLAGRKPAGNKARALISILPSNSASVTELILNIIIWRNRCHKSGNRTSRTQMFTPDWDRRHSIGGQSLAPGFDSESRPALGGFCVRVSVNE